MSYYPTWFSLVLFITIDLIIDQHHDIPSAYPALTQDVCGQMFDSFVDQDVVSASSDLYHSLGFENQHTYAKNQPYGIEIAETVGQLRLFMLVWKLATDDSVMRGNNSSKIVASTIIQNVKLTSHTHYLCNGTVRIIFDDKPEPYVLSLEAISEKDGSAIRSG
ncbi:MAG: hypothetical protein EZS28_023427 [Streblomastix strix]|uniref:Uncharacterized protein n=1 Tax=Streblomastix strix TaxID=222440 RepID=A0A5J4VF93_9EUKA|nr:MAG: hypothetical protein EZS28_023427 [Streblomastix strix]